MAEATQEELDRFMSYVDKLPNGCWFWTGGRSRGKGNRKWYGSFWFRGKTIRAHKFACDFIGHFEPLPPGQHRDHTCVFSLCVNPEHLEKVTPKVNQERKVQKRVAFEGPKMRGPMAEAIRARPSLHPVWQRLKDLGMWPFDKPNYDEPVNVKTVGYGCG